MSFQFALTILAGLGLTSGAAWAEVPHVATDIAPVHSLVARVMEGLGKPVLIIPANTSPHDYAMRPSEAAALENAEIVFWVAEALTPRLKDPLGTLAGKAHVVTLLGANNSLVLPFRTGVAFETHGHEEHEGEGHVESHDENEGEEHSQDQGHDHEGADPHAWLDTRNARAWFALIAGELAEQDPENAQIYAANAAAAMTELDSLDAEIISALAPVKDRPFLVFHDAYQYFEARFGIAATGAISLGDAADPGPARITALRELARDQGVVCVFSEPQFDPRIVQTVFGDVAVHGKLDPIGTDLEPGSGLYPALLRNLAAAMVDCLNFED